MALVRRIWVVVAASLVAIALTGPFRLPYFPTPSLSSASEAQQVSDLDSDGDGQADRPDTVSAALAAQSTEQRVEDLSQRTEDTQVFANPDGSWTSDTSTGPVRAQDPANGDWSPIDTTLWFTGSDWQPRTVASNISFSNGGSQPFVTIMDLEGKTVSWSWPSTLPVPTASGSTLTYANAVPNGDLVVTALADGFSESVVLRQAPTANLQLALSVHTDGADLDVATDGSIVITDGNAPLLSAPAPTMWDSSSDPGSESGDISVAAQDTKAGSRLLLTPDDMYLSDPQTKYPVTIDPTFTMSATSSSWIQTPSSTNGSVGDPWLKVGTTDSGASIARSFLNIDTSALAGKDIVSAQLGLYAATSAVCQKASLRIQRVNQAWAPSTLTWGNQPTVSSNGQSTASQTAKGGPSGCTAQGWDYWDVSTIVQAWATGTSNNGLRLSATDETVNSSWRTYFSPHYTGTGDVLPRIVVTWNQPPATPAAPTPSDSQNWQGATYTRVATPAWTTFSTDPDLGTLRYTTEVHDSTSAGSPVLATCTTPYVASGTQSTCTPSASLAKGAYFVRSSASDGRLASAWSPWQQVYVNYDQPEPATVACTGVADQHWYSAAPPTTTTCTFTSPSAVQLEWTLNGGASSILTANASGSATSPPISIPSSGWTQIQVRGLSNAGRATAWQQFSFGTGSAAITSPTDNAQSATTFTFTAASISGAESAVLQYFSGTTWQNMTAVRTADGSVWNGSVTSSTYITTTPAVTWTPSAEAGIHVPQMLQTRAVFLWRGGSYLVTSPTKTLQLTAHAATSAGPSTTVGPGSVSLASGEFEMSAADVAIGDLGISRTHLSNAPISGNGGVFGPGWSSSTATHGPATFTVNDQRATSAAFVFQTPDGLTYSFQKPGPAASNLTGGFQAIGDAAATGAAVNVSSDGTVLSYTEPSGDRTTFEVRNNRWQPSTTATPGTNTTTSYAYNTDGLISWIIAPAPAGVSCTAGSLVPGCQALHLNYVATANGTRVDSVEFTAWDPGLNDTDGDSNSDGLPDATAALRSVTVARYAYDANGRLSAEWDPRVGDGANALKTTYEYVASGSNVRLSTVTPPGQQPWQVSYGSDGAVNTVTRLLDPATGTGTATWSVVYGLPLTGNADLPVMTAVRTGAWGQAAADAPDTGAAVFPPNRVPSSGGPSATDWKYAKLFYWNAAGRLTNEASWGANAWQISSTRYDTVGNEVWSLTPAAKAQAINDGQGNAANSAAAADRYATVTLYNTAGTRVEAIYGPTRNVLTEGGTWATLRTLTRNTYDDEPPAGDDSLRPGRPTPPDGGYNLVVEELSSGTDEATPGSWAAGLGAAPSSVHLFDTHRVRYRYDSLVTNDPLGWDLHQPTQVLNEVTPGTWESTGYRYDTAGRLVELRTPEGMASGQQTRYHDTVYYTADQSANRSECRGNAAWAGLECWSGPAVQPGSGQGIPTTSHTGYSYLGAVTRTVQSAGGAAQVQVTQLDIAGRPMRRSASSTGAGDQAMPASTYTYNASNGLPWTTSNGTSTLTTGYDSWGRVVSQTDGAGNTSTTSFNADGSVATENDGKGTYAYGYQDNSGSEQRGMATSVDAGVPGVSRIFVTYDPNGNLVNQDFGGASGIAETQKFDLADQLRETSVSFQDDAGNVEGSQVTRTSAGQFRYLNDVGRIQNYRYDYKGRLVWVQDKYFTSNCKTRVYSLTPDSDRSSFSTYAEDDGGNCNDGGTPQAAVTGTYDNADRLINAGYSYDDLGRTITVPGSDTATTGGGQLTARYYPNDMAASLTQSATVAGVTTAKTQTFTLDPLSRVSIIDTATNGVVLNESVNHYRDTTDNPAWTELKTRPNASTAWTSTWVRYVAGLNNRVAMVQFGSGSSPQVQIYNAHGDNVSSINMGAYYFNQYTFYTEFGGTRDGSISTTRYGWIGQSQRDSQSVGGLTLMGARLYNFKTGRFLTRDQYAGGNDNAYTYPSDPLNKFDATGKYWAGSQVTWYSNIFNRWDAGHHWWNYAGIKRSVHFNSGDVYRVATGGWDSYQIMANSIISMLGSWSPLPAAVLSTWFNLSYNQIVGTARLAYNTHKLVRVTLYFACLPGNQWCGAQGFAVHAWVE